MSSSDYSYTIPAITPSEDELPEVVADWQERLHLGHWQIAVRYSKAKVLKNKAKQPCDGCIEIVEERLAAAVDILQPGRYPKGATVSQDVERTIIHELLHIWIRPFEPEEGYHREHIAMEQAIDALSRSLLHAKREEERWRGIAHNNTAIATDALNELSNLWQEAWKDGKNPRVEELLESVGQNGK